MNQLVTNKTKKKMIMRQTLRKLKACFALRAAFIMLCAVFYAVPMMAQNVYMHSGTQTVPTTGSLNFYDSGGPSSPDYWWEKWYSHNENATLVFKNGTSPVLVTFNQFTAYDGNTGANIGQYSLRINDDHLYVYEGEGTNNLIVDLTGTIKESFSIMANGPITFKFVSNGSYREEGWAASVSTAASYVVQKPIIVKDDCDDAVVIYPMAYNATIYYTTNGSNPTTSSTEYDGAPFNIDLDATNASVTVKAIAVVEDQSNSAVASHTFTHADQRPIPGTPNISIEGNMVHITPAAVPEGLNETYNVRYTTNGEDPSANNGTLITSPWAAFEWHTPNTTFKAVTVAVDCPDKVSAVVSETFGNVKVPTPTITFNANGTATISCSLTGATIYYTIDGSTPTTTSTLNGTTPVTTAALNPGTTVKAIAYYNSTGYVVSDIASEIYVPAGGNTTNGSVVLLDDREDHSWSYYSDATSPIKSLNPTDIKITYYGNSPAGRTTMTNSSENGNTPSSFSATATGVQVNVGETENQFIYLKTLEKDQSTTNEYPYTAIPNPFQVRPKFDGSGGNSFSDVTDFESTNHGWTMTGTSGNRWYRGTAANNGGSYGMYIYNGGTNTTYGYNNYSNTATWSYAHKTLSLDAGSYTISFDWRCNGEASSYSTGTIYDYLRVFLAPSSATFTQGTAIDNLSYNSVPSGWQALDGGALYGSTSWSTKTTQFTVSSSGNYKVVFVWRNDSSTQNQPPAAIDNISITAGGGSSNNYRGFYAWRVKSLSSGLAIHRANGTNVPLNGLVYADEDIKFVTSNEEGNEVEFEALWAQAYVATSTTSTGGLVSAVGYERNFIVLANASGTSISGITVPCTISSYNPDGTGGSSTSYLSSVGTLGADLKVENIKMSALYNDSYNYYTTLAGNDFILGRGVNVYSNHESCVGPIRGLAAAATSPNFIIRLESGIVGSIYAMGAASPLNLSGNPHVKVVLGSDYDRATNNNVLLKITGVVRGGSNLVFESSNVSNINYDYIVKSGTMQSSLTVGDGGLSNAFYLGGLGSGDYTTQYQGGRRLIIEGGQFKSIAGGFEYTGTSANEGVYIRMRGGEVLGCVYGAAAYAQAYGDRRFVFTGGTVNGWIAGGCNGTTTDGGQTDGNTYIYFGGKAKCSSNGNNTLINSSRGGNIFGAGSGIEGGTTVGQVNNSTIVIADNAEVEHSVYGGGNYGYITEGTGHKSDIHVLGGTIGESVYGGANQQQGQIVNIKMKNGTVMANLYGGSNSLGTVKGLATIEVTGGTVNNVFGGGKGSGTDMTGGTKVTISNGTINNNVYGGGEEGTVSSGDTEVNISGGTMKDVYGAGKGATSQPATVTGQTNVNISGGTIANVYGGGQNGNVVQAGGYAPGESDTYDFDDSSLSGWTNIDADGDGFVWVLGSACNGVYLYGGNLANSGHNSSADLVVSGSYRNTSSTSGVALTPDNYLVSPLIELGGSISFYACAQDATYAAEVFGVAVSTTGNTNASNFTTIQQWTMTSKGVGTNTQPGTTRGGNRAQGNWHQYTVDLSAYSGQGYVAIRHFGCTDQFILDVDDITITGPDVPLPSEFPASVVSVSGGAISGDVFGGGKMGTTTGAVTTNVSGGNIRGNVFGGAEGEQKKVFVTGLRTVNMTGGHVYGNVYGGSRNANDGNSLSLQHSDFANSTETGTISVTNISGGTIDQNVYAAGYYGNTFGSVYAFIGKNAIENAPNHRPTPTYATYNVKTLNILGTVWAGGDWGTFSGSFGGPTISGNSSIYVDGLDYETTTTQTSNAQYMNIGGSILGCGTSCDAGKAERTIMVRNYGTDNTSSSKDEPFVNATRTLYSIQRAKVLIIDNSHLNFSGQGKVNSLNATEKYAIYEIANTGNTTITNDYNFTEDLNYGLRLVNGSSIYLNAPVSQISNFISASCSDIYTASLTEDYTPLTPSDLNSIDNKVRVNGGNYVEVKYGNKFCMLKGYAHMMVSTNETDATCAYARPRWETNAPFAINNNSYDNRDDGGWVSYTASKNKFDLAGNNPVNPGVQMAYENHTQRNGEDYFRIWRDGDTEHYREGVFDAHASGTTNFKTTDVTITLPPLRDRSYVYRFETVGDGTNTSIAFGSDVMAYDAARATGTGDDWISYTDSQHTGQSQATVQNLINEGIMANPDINFGLIAMPTPGMGLTGGTYLISQNSDQNLANTSTQFTNDDFTKEDQITFRLTYYDKLSSNMTWDPITIVLVQVDPLHPDVVLDRVTISLAVNTSTTITQEFTTTLFAVMQGKASNSETYTAKVTLPHFTVVSGQESSFIVNSVSFTPNGIDNNDDGIDDEFGNLITRGGTYTKTDFAVTYGAANNYDNTNGWASTTGQNHDANQTTDVLLGKTGGRNEFAIDFQLHYNGHENITTTDTLGVLTFNITFDYFVDEDENVIMDQPMTIVVYVIRRGQGTKFYLDGVNGSNRYDGKHPDEAALTLSYIFNRLGYLAGDEIYIVNKVTIDKQLTWNGSAYDNVLIYRYDGGHELATSTGIIGNSGNEAYLDTLVYVTHSLVMTGITLDGHYNNGVDSIPISYTATDTIYGPFTPVTAAAPMIVIANGAKVELNEGALLRQNNNNSSDGGAVYVAEGGTLMMNADATIAYNKTAGEGGGVYMAGTLNVSDDIQIYDNKKGTAQNNVYLTEDKVVTIGTGNTTDAYDALSSNAKVGVTKVTTNVYTEVVHVDSENDVPWLDVPMPRPNTVIFHDANIYELERYTDITYLYWIGTWVTRVTWNPYFDSRDDDEYTDYMTEAQLADITTAEQLAWVISMANGENYCTPQSGMHVVIKNDIDMDASIWVPIGTTANPFDGNFDGGGNVVEGIHSTLVHTNMGVFGTANGTIHDAIFKVDFDANSTNMGTVAGTMTGGTISNVEASGNLKGGSLTENMGGLVGKTTGGTIHSSFAVNTMAGVETTVMGGLVGTNNGDLINSYANTAMSASEHIGGLVGDNNGRVENCYVVVGVKDYPSFANTNSATGIITYCYADKAGNYIGTDNNSTAQPTLSGNYSATIDRKALGYMYGDNIVTAPGNAYVKTTHEYPDKHNIKWDGLLSVLNQWVTDNPGYTKWYRPTTQNINGDLPILAFPTAISLATENSDKKFLHYSDDLDHLLEEFGGKTASIFLYGDAVNVQNVPGNNLYVYINENVVLKQSGTGVFKNAVVGITFDNSDHGQHASDYFGNTLDYDWHLLSTPLANAPLGISYGDVTTNYNYWEHPNTDKGQAVSVANSYMPNMARESMTDNWECRWDFYTYYEPQYHWINFKRNINSHHHYDEPHDGITYTGMEQTGNEVQGNLIRGRGYMMAIDQDSYLSSTGTLNNGDVPMPLTYSNPGTAPETELPSKDWGSNLVGNPYQAYLNLDAVTAGEGNGGLNSFYIYDADNGTYGPYMTGASVNPAIPSKFIHPHQAFFVVTNSNLSTFKFTYDMATTNQNPASYFRGDEDQVKYPLVNIFAENERGNRDLAVIEFNRPELGGALKINNLRNANFKVWAQLEGQRYGLVFTPEGTQKVPVHFQTTEDGTYTLRWETFHGDFTSLRLVDNKTGVNYDMLANDSYTFEASSEDYTSRFYITFAVTDVEEYNETNNGFAFFNGSEWIINGKGHLDVIDMTGRVLYAAQLNNDQNRVHLDGVAKGVYLLRVIDNKVVRTQKIIVR